MASYQLAYMPTYLPTYSPIYIPIYMPTPTHPPTYLVTNIPTYALIYFITYLPSKHAGFDLHLVRIGWKALARSGPDDSCTLACFRAGSVWPKPDTISQN